MVSEFTFNSELDSVNSLLSKEIYFKTASFEELIKMELDDLDRNVCPALVLAASKTGGGIDQSSLNMAAIIQFTFLADKVHNLMTDDNDLSEDERQFPVLVGDFLYGKFFLGLSRSNLLQYLEPIAQVIKRMSEAMVLRWENKNRKLNLNDWLEIFEKERGFITGIGAKIGAELSGAPEDYKNQCEQFGRLMGMAWAAFNENMEIEVIKDILNKAKAILEKLQKNYKVDPLYEVYNYIERRLGLAL